MGACQASILLVAGKPLLGCAVLTFVLARTACTVERLLGKRYSWLPRGHWRVVRAGKYLQAAMKLGKGLTDFGSATLPFESSPIRSLKGSSTSCKVCKRKRTRESTHTRVRVVCVPCWSPMGVPVWLSERPGL